jgi:hypothetical protein
MLKHQAAAFVDGYLNEEPNPVVWACGMQESGKVCGERLMRYTGPKPDRWKHAVGYCPVHGIVPLFPALEEEEKTPADRLGFEPFSYVERN